MTLAGGRLYVANRFDDTVSVIDPNRPAVIGSLALGPKNTPTTVETGEALFYDARLSLDGWFSCHSCHTDGHSNGLANDNFGDETFGTPKQIPSLLGVGRTGPWGWLGNKPTLEAQITASVATTLHGKPLTPKQTGALAAYLRTLPPPPPVIETEGDDDQPAIRRGRKLFDRLQCADCHKPPTWTSDKTHKVDFTDEAGRNRFNPPSLLGVSRRRRLLHDGRAIGLKHLFSTLGHEQTRQLNRQEVDDLITFLKTL